MDAITENILDVTDKLLETSQQVVIKSNDKYNTSSTFLRILDAVALYIASNSTGQQKVFRKQNIALAIQNKSKSFTLVAKDESNLLDIQSVDGEVLNQTSAAKLFIPQSLLKKADRSQVYSYVYRSGLLFSQPFGNNTLHSIIISASVPGRKISNLVDPVVITFQNKNQFKPRKNQISTCQFWLPEEKGN